MLDVLAELPFWLGAAVSILMACASRLVVYTISDRRISTAESTPITYAAASLFTVSV